MTKQFLLILFSFMFYSLNLYSQDVDHLLKINESMESCLKKKDYLGTIKYADYLISNAPKNSDLHAWAYLEKSLALDEIGNYRDVIINTSKALSLDTEVALFIRQPDLPDLIQMMKSILYELRGIAKLSIGLTESGELDRLKAKEYQ